jgi:rod shape-determining protein MreB and related proteins
MLLLSGETRRKRFASQAMSLCSGFNHPRVVLGNFEDTQNVLEQFVLRAFGGKRTLLAYRMLIHPFPPMEGGLSDLEERGLMELGRQIGAREVVACQHPQELSDNDLTDFSQWRLPLGERMIQRRIAR